MANSDRRAAVLARNFKTFAVDATVELQDPEATPIETLREDGGGVLWLTPTTEDTPIGARFKRKGPRRVLAMRKVDVPTCPLGTLIKAPTEAGGDIRRWFVVGVALDEAEHRRVTVVADDNPPVEFEGPEVEEE